MASLTQKTRVRRALRDRKMGLKRKRKNNKIGTTPKFSVQLEKP